MYKRIIPCLDYLNGRIVKGTNFNNLIDIGDPIEISKYYNDNGADELIFLDISATLEKKTKIDKYIEKISSKIFIPLTVGGGINSFNQIRCLLNSGADKVSLNSFILNNCKIINKISNIYGKQCLIAAIDVERNYFNKFYFGWKVKKNSGKNHINLSLYDLILKYKDLGIGELLLTSIDRDGTGLGYDLEVFYKVSNLIDISIIASGGFGFLKNLIEISKIKNIKSILIAGKLHKKKYSIYLIKNFLINNGILVKI